MAHVDAAEIPTAVLVSTLLVACSSPSNAGGDDGAPASEDAAVGEAATPAGDAAPDPPDAGRAPDATDAATFADDVPFAERRASCAFKAGALPSETFGASIAKLAIPLDVIVVAIQENRSFDHYFWRLREAPGGYADADVPTSTITLPAPDGGAASSFHQTSYCIADLGHAWTTQHSDYNGGAMDRFALNNATTADPLGARVLGWYDETDLPFYYALATTFGVSDRHFCSVMGPTFPNRFYAYQGTSNGYAGNTAESAGEATIFALLTKANVAWAVYSYSSTDPLESIYGTSLCTKYPGRCRSTAQFDADAKAGTLPKVVFLDAGSSEHAPGDMQNGQHDVATRLGALMSGPQWKDAAFILTYDENGGLYDHVPPAPACVPDATKPIGVAGAFDRTGFRVPLLVASPWSRPHHLSHVVTDHTSILRFLELRFGLPALTARDANANVPLDFFDFTSRSFATRPSLPSATVDASKLCSGPP